MTKDNNTMNFKIVKLEESNKELNNDVKRLDTMQKEKVMGKKIDSMSEELERINNQNDKLTKDLKDKEEKRELEA